MHITILQIDDIKNDRRIKNGGENLIYKPYNPKTFDLKNYCIIDIYNKYTTIKERYDAGILDKIEKEFKSFYTSEARPENGVIVSDVVKIGQRIYFYNGESGWLYLGKDKPRRW